jgi:hypothetical protein
MYPYFLTTLSIIYLLWVSTQAAAKQPKQIASLYDLILVLTLFVGIPYLTVVVLGDGLGYIEYVRSFNQQIINEPTFWSSVNVQAIAFIICDVAIRIVQLCLLIYSYQKIIEEVGFGPSAIPDHLFENRDHGWEGGVHLRVCGVNYVATSV